jgi:hypothetical protein
VVGGLCFTRGGFSLSLFGFRLSFGLGFCNRLRSEESTVRATTLVLMAVKRKSIRFLFGDRQNDVLWIVGGFPSVQTEVTVKTGSEIVRIVCGGIYEPRFGHL